VAGETVWTESLYVAPACRRRGIASTLHTEAERLVEQLGGDTVYSWVHSDNASIIRFLQQRGYNVLNLIEVPRPRGDQTLKQRIGVGDHEFDY
jgi:ribosomal protein S18 acetylase RimI-like enzyme